MKYVGGKHRHGRTIAGLIQRAPCESGIFYEPFVGMFNIVPHIAPDTFRQLHCSDIDFDIIFLFSAIQAGYMPPDAITQKEYERLKSERKQFDPLTSFASIACTVSGAKWAGYAKAKSQDYVGEAKRLLLKKAQHFDRVRFTCRSFDTVHPTEGSVIYCDPPYAGTFGYKLVFPHASFWQKVRDWSSHSVVLVSEYRAPEDFVSIWHVDRGITTSPKKYGKVRDHVFVHKSLAKHFEGA